MKRTGLTVLATIFAAAAALSAYAASDAENPNASGKAPKYAAVAVAEKSRHYGMAYNQPTRALAYRIAMEQCTRRAKAPD